MRFSPYSANAEGLKKHVPCRAGLGIVAARRHRVPNHLCIACIRQQHCHFGVLPRCSPHGYNKYVPGELAMARQKSLASMSVEALFALRDDVSRILSEKAQDLRQQLARLGGGEGGTVGNGRRRGASLKGRKVAPKNRDPDSGATWAGRGARPRWLQAAI